MINIYLYIHACMYIFLFNSAITCILGDCLHVQHGFMILGRYKTENKSLFIYLFFFLIFFFFDIAKQNRQ